MAWLDLIFCYVSQLCPFPYPRKEDFPYSVSLAFIFHLEPSLVIVMVQFFLSIFLLSSYAETLDPWLCLKAQCKIHLCEAFSDVCHVPSLLHALHSLFSVPAICAASHHPTQLFLAIPYSPSGPAQAGLLQEVLLTHCDPQTLARGRPKLDYQFFLLHTVGSWAVWFNLSGPPLPCPKIGNKKSFCPESCCQDEIRK